MATEWISPTWRMPEESNQSKFSNYSMSFDSGSNNWIELTDSESLFNGLTAFSVSLWLNPSATQAAYTSPFSFRSASTQYLKLNFGATPSNNQLEINFRNTDTALATSSINSIPLNTWTNVIVVFDASSSLSLYVNGSLDGQDTTSLPTSAVQSTNVYIGTDAGSTTGRDFNGKLDHCCIFDYALSQDQRNYLYNSGTPQNPMAISGNAPIAYYALGDSSTGSADDPANTLTVPNSSVPSATVFDFNTQDYIEYPHVSINGAFTVSTWVKTTDTSTYGNLFSSSNQFGGGPNIFNNWKLIRWSRSARFNASDSSNSIIFDVNTGTSGTRPNLYDGNWHHVLAIWDGTTNSNGVKIFFDGVLRGLGAASSTAINTDSSIPIRAGSSDATLDFIGEQSNQQIWNTALTYGSASADGDIAGGEVATLYNNGVPYTGTQPQSANLKGWWKMNVDTSTWNSVLNQWEIIDYAN